MPVGEMPIEGFYPFLLHLFERYWLIKPCRFQVYNSIKHHHPKSSLFLSPCIPPLPTSTSSHPTFCLVVTIVLFASMWHMRPVQKVSSYVLWKRHIYWRAYKIQETLYVGLSHLGPLQSRHPGTSHSSPNHHQLPHSIFLNLINGLKSLPYQRWF